MTDRSLYVAAQIKDTREWVPVARLASANEHFSLNYTAGALRVPGFVGFGRMTDLAAIYSSNTLFPFFANRLTPRGRPEYKNYIGWLGLEGVDDDPISVLSVTAGVRQTDEYEIIANPNFDAGWLTLDFFPKGIRYLHHLGIELISRQAEGARLCLMRDFQNTKDLNALLIRTEDPICIVGYVPRYYCQGINRLLEAGHKVELFLRRLNGEAPLDMKVLCRLRCQCEDGFNMFNHEPDFSPASSRVPPH